MFSLCGVPREGLVPCILSVEAQVTRAISRERATQNLRIILILRVNVREVIGLVRGCMEILILVLSCACDSHMPQSRPIWWAISLASPRKDARSRRTAVFSTFPHLRTAWLGMTLG